MTIATMQPHSEPPMARGVAQPRSLFDRQIFVQGVIGSFKKFDPRV